MILVMQSGNDSASRTNCGRDQLEVVILSLSIADVDMDSSPVCGMSSWYYKFTLIFYSGCCIF